METQVQKVGEKTITMVPTLSISKTGNLCLKMQ